MDKSNRSDKGRKKYFSDYPFQDVPKKSGDGTKRRRRYAGEHYSYVIPEDYKDSPDTFRARIKGFYAVITFLMAALWVAGSFVRTAGHTEGTVYVTVSYVIMAIPIVLILFTMVEFLFTKNPLYERAFADALTKNLRAKTIFAMICAGFCIVTEAIYLVTKITAGAITEGNIAVDAIDTLGITHIPLWNDLVYIAFFVGVGLLAFFFLKLQDSLKMETL